MLGAYYDVLHHSRLSNICNKTHLDCSGTVWFIPSHIWEVLLKVGWKPNFSLLLVFGGIYDAIENFYNLNWFRLPLKRVRIAQNRPRIPRNRPPRCTKNVLFQTYDTSILTQEMENLGDFKWNWCILRFIQRIINDLGDKTAKM
jgi:hypothetical protein